MPTAALKSMADKAGKSISKVEELWKKAVKEAKSRASGGKTDKVYPYAMGILKNMLGIESADLILAGLPADTVWEMEMIPVRKLPVEEGIDPKIAALTLVQLYAAETTKTPTPLFRIPEIHTVCLRYHPENKTDGPHRIRIV